MMTEMRADKDEEKWKKKAAKAQKDKDKDAQDAAKKIALEQEREEVLPVIEEDLVVKDEAYCMKLKVDRLNDILLYYYDVPKKESRQ